jgi:hypothetical protein
VCIGGLAMRFVMIAALVLAMGLTTPAGAQDAGGAHRLELAQRLVELSSGDSFEKMLEEQIQTQMAALGDVRTPEADWMRANLPRMAMQTISRMMPELVALYADVFSEAELEAQITLYESPVGRSIANKSVQLGVRQQVVVMQAMEGYLEELTTKYCAEFDCSGTATDKSHRQ